MSSPAMVVLLWHGRGRGEADVFAPLVERLEPHTRTVTPQWDSQAPDHGRGALLDSLVDARELADCHRCPLVVGGWSLGATAAVSLVLDAQHCRGVGAIVGLAVDPNARSPLTGSVLSEQIAGAHLGPAIRLAHGRDDEIVEVAAAQALERQLIDHGHEISLEVVATNHAGILGARYCAATRRCLPSFSRTAAAGLTAAAAAVRDAGIAAVPEAMRHRVRQTGADDGACDDRPTSTPTRIR